ncbi:MAG: leucine-rich repeat domain-containing protein [Ruminococcus sp.]|nr:leucine-rich repeat domain-containing protein [Ruminococcus sp.]
MWIIQNNKLTNTTFITDFPTKFIVLPFPKLLWRVENGRLTHEFLPDEISEKTVTKPYPKALWRIDDDILYHELLPLEKPSGAFMNAVRLEYVRIPESVRKIGRYAFAGTALRKVKIPSDCEYYETSFPENCAVEFYENIAENGSSEEKTIYV